MAIVNLSVKRTVPETSNVRLVVKKEACYLEVDREKAKVFEF
jgi:hypothetical protein